MLTRRHLFRTLSAIAVAPLAKWLPKRKAMAAPVSALPTGWVKIGLRWETDKTPEIFLDGIPLREADWVACGFVPREDSALICMEVNLKPVPQEEA